MKAISPIIAIVVLMLMTIAAAGMAYLTIVSYQEQAARASETGVEAIGSAALSQVKVESIKDGKLYLRSIGASCESVIAQVGNEPAQILGDCLENTTLTAFRINSSCTSGYQTVKVISGNNIVTHKILCSDIIGEQVVCDLQYSTLSSPISSMSEPPFGAIPMNVSDLLGQSFYLSQGFEVTSVDVRLNNTINAAEIRVYITDTDPSTVAPWTIFSTPNGTAVADPGDIMVNVPINATLSPGIFYVLVGTNSTTIYPGGDAFFAYRTTQTEEIIYVCGPTFNIVSSQFPDSCNVPTAAYTGALIDIWVNTGTCDCGDEEVDSGEDCSTCWDDVKCPAGEGCSVGVCTTCSSTCDGVCDSGRDCYSYDPDCDPLGGSTWICCGNGKCEDGEDSSCVDCPILAYTFSDGDYSKTLSFSGAGSNNSAKVIIPKTADIRHASVNIVGATNNLNLYGKKISEVSLPNGADGVFVLGNYAYVADMQGGLRIVNITDHYNPAEVGYNDTGAVVYYRDVYVLSEGNEDLAYVCVESASTGLYVVNVTNKTDPIEVNKTDVPCYNGIDIVGDYAYLAAGSSGLRVVNITNRTGPVEVGFNDTCAVSDCYWGLDVVGGVEDYAYVATVDTAAGLKIVNVTNKTNPVEIGAIEGYPGLGVHVVGNYAYFATDFYGLLVVDVSDETNPIEVGRNPFVPGRGIHVSGNLAYSPYSNTDLKLVDVSDKTDPLATLVLEVPESNYFE
jgi:flagellin-like protein